MKLYSISYDLRKQRNYEPLWKALKDANGARILESHWMLRSALSATALRDELSKLLDGDDGVAVFEVPSNGDWAVSKVYAEGMKILEAA